MENVAKLNTSEETEETPSAEERTQAEINALAIPHLSEPVQIREDAAGNPVVTTNEAFHARQVLHRKAVFAGLARAFEPTEVYRAGLRTGARAARDTLGAVTVQTTPGA